MPKNNFSAKIKKYLLDKRLLSAEELVEVEKKIETSKKSAEEVLIEEKKFTAEKFNAIKGEIYNLPAQDLSGVAVPKEVLNLLTQKVVKNYQMVVFGQEGKAVKVGLVDPENFQAHEAMEFLAQQQGLATKYFTISLADFQKIFDQYGSFKKDIGTAVESAKVKFEEKTRTLELPADQDMETAVKSAPVAKIVSVIIKHALEGGASDIHIEPGQNEGRVRYRVDGNLHTSLTLPSYLHAAVVSRIKVLANLKLDENRLPQDGRIRAKIDNQEIDLRVSVLPMLDNEKVVMRVLDTSAGVPTLAVLGFSEHDIEVIDRNIKKPHGLFLLTGPTGSGKTTTLYSVLNILNSESYNVTTLEDPIEYYVNGVNQSQINPDIGFTFASGLRSILRQDPNIIMVGEIRDNETVELVIHAGLTGHLVFSTLHTNNAWGSIPRLIDMKAQPFLLASTLNLIMAQRLVRKLCPNCREEIKLPPNLEAQIKEEIKQIPPEFLKEFKNNFRVYRGKGCTSCSNSGYIGRTVISEVLEIGNDLRDLIARDFTMEQIRAEIKKQGFIDLKQDGILKALKGLTTMEEVMRASQI